MEQTLVHIATDAAWVFFIIFVFALIGVYATIRWIVGLMMNTERAVETGVRDVEDRITGREQ
jgi:hypothetical protein